MTSLNPGSIVIDPNIPIDLGEILRTSRAPLIQPMKLGHLRPLGVAYEGLS